MKATQNVVKIALIKTNIILQKQFLIYLSLRYPLYKKMFLLIYKKEVKRMKVSNSNNNL